MPRATSRPASEANARPVTGRTVLFALVGFFAFVVLVNLVMVRAAITTFGGVDTPSSYQAGLAFKSEEVAAEAQNGRHWSVSIGTSHTAAGENVAVQVLDAAGVPVHGAGLGLRFAHPIDGRRDVAIAMTEVEQGTYRGNASVEPGQWILELDISTDGERLYRSRNRVVIE